MYEDSPEIPRAQLQTMQIIAFALPVGLLIFLGVSAYLVHVVNGGQGLGAGSDLPIVTLVSLAIMGSNLPVSLALPRIIERTGLRNIAAGKLQLSQQVTGGQTATDDHRLMAVRQTSLIISLALVEAFGFLGCIGYLLEANFLALIPVGVALGMMGVFFPTKSAVASWLAARREDLERERQFVQPTE